MNAFKWICPFCNHAGIVTEANYRCNTIEVNLAEAKATNPHSTGGDKINVEVVVCPNPECGLSTLTACVNMNAYWKGSLGTTPNPRSTTMPPPPLGTPNPGSLMPTPQFRQSVSAEKKKLVKKWNLVPASTAKVFPSYVPESIRSDYTEACLIRDLSPKASATLARRCLQGMIRDYWKISKNRLVDEIEAIKDRVDPLAWRAIEAVRHVGNIGAHMEKDVDIIVEVEPDEASQLVNLIEMLIHDWYIVRHERTKQFETVGELASVKKDQQKGRSNSRNND